MKRIGLCWGVFFLDMRRLLLRLHPVWGVDNLELLKVLRDFHLPQYYKLERYAYLQVQAVKL